MRKKNPRCITDWPLSDATRMKQFAFFFPGNHPPLSLPLPDLPSVFLLPPVLYRASNKIERDSATPPEKPATAVLHFLEHWAGSLVILSRATQWGRRGVDSRVAFRSWKNRNSQEGFWVGWGKGMVMWSRFQGLVIIEWGERAVSPWDFETVLNVQSEAASEKLQPGEGRKGYARESFEKRGAGKKRPSRWTSCRDGGRKLIIFRLPGVTMAFCAFDGGLGDVFLGQGWGCGCLTGEIDLIGWQSIELLIFFLKERESWLVERLYWKDNEMLEWLMEYE